MIVGFLRSLIMDTSYDVTVTDQNVRDARSILSTIEKNYETFEFMTKTQAVTLQAGSLSFRVYSPKDLMNLAAKLTHEVSVFESYAG